MLGSQITGKLKSITRTKDVSDELVAFVGELALGEELGVACHPAAGLHPAGLLRICIASGDQRMPVHLLHMYKEMLSVRPI